MKRIKKEKPFLEYRRMWAWLWRREGFFMNKKRGYRIMKKNKQLNSSSFKRASILKIIGFLFFFGIAGFSIWLYRENKLPFDWLNKFFEKSEPEIKIKRNIAIHISGEVQSPGLYIIKSYMRLGELIEKAGGLTPQADISDINFARRIYDGEKIIIPAANILPAKKSFLKD